MVRGDPSGVVTKIVWKGGRPDRDRLRPELDLTAERGLLPRQVRIELRAQHLGRCDGQLVYRQLDLRLPAKPDGPLGKWFLWSGAKNLCAKSPELSAKSRSPSAPRAAPADRPPRRWEVGRS